MISKNQLKQIRALGQKKQRKQQGAFLVQGEKNVIELLKSELAVINLFVTQQFVDSHSEILKNISYVLSEESELEKASTLVSNNAAIAIARMPESKKICAENLLIALDGVSDPGNLGTIIRLADWYGIPQVLLGAGCADPYNPKTISATMGSFTRVDCLSLDLSNFLAGYQGPVYGAYLEGESVHSHRFANSGVLLMGSESHGISQQMAEYVTNKITIPSFGEAESLNVAIATGIILDNYKRNQ